MSQHKINKNDIVLNIPNVCHPSVCHNEELDGLYISNYYIKDFKYLNPELVNLNKNFKVNSYVETPQVNEKSQKSLLEIWFVEVTKGIKQFFYQGSLHGVKYIFEPTFGMMEKLTWILIMIISIIICGIVMIQLFTKWTSTPFVNVIDSVPTPIWAVPFPNVVVCPHLHVKSSYIDVTKVKGLQKFFASLVCPRMSSEKRFRGKHLDPQEMNKFKDFILDASPTCGEVIKACKWPAIHTTSWETDRCCDLFQPIFTNYGLCYAFNSLPLNAMTNDTKEWQKSFNVDVKPATLEWNLDTGYPKIFPPNLMKKPYRVMASGEDNGLGIELFMNNSEYQSNCEGNSLGFTILINSPTDNVYASTVLRLPMDRMTTVQVNPLAYKTDSSLRSLSSYKRQCFFQDEKKLQYYEYYTDGNCKHDMLVRESKKMCDCVLFNWPRKLISEPVCSTKVDYDCINKVAEKVEEQLVYVYYAESENENERGIEYESRSCHPSCNDIKYGSQVFYSDLTEDLENGSHKWGKLRPGEITQINIHFYEDLFLGQHRHAQYDDYYFVGAIGGLLSLFLGFSLISVAELIYFVVIRPVYLVIKEMRQQKI